MSRRNRPTAFDISFPDEVQSSTTTASRASHSSNALSTSSKRRERENDKSGSEPKRKRTAEAQNAQPYLHYSPHVDDMREKRGLRIRGEDAGEDDEADATDLPVRILSDFCIFDAHDDYRVYSLDDDDPGRRLEAAGVVAPLFVDEEDAGQDDGVDDADDDTRPQRLRTSTIKRYVIDYTKRDDPIYILTEHAWYLLRNPSQVYSACYINFFRPHRIAQLVICAAIDDPRCQFSAFKRIHVDAFDWSLNAQIVQQDVDDAIPLINMTVSDLEYADDVLRSPLLRHLLGPTPLHRRTIVASARHSHPSAKSDIGTSRRLSGNIDLAVLRPENQNPTHVTPLISQLAIGLFPEHLKVVGARLPERDWRQDMERERRWLIKLLSKWHTKMTAQYGHKPRFPINARIEDKYWKCFNYGEETYSLGDVVLVPAGPYPTRKEAAAVCPPDPNQIPHTATVADYFWFIRIVYIDQKEKKLHGQWFDHASKSLLQELANPQQLFLINTCDTISINLIVAKVNVQWGSTPASVNPWDFYCSYIYNEVDASFSTIPQLMTDSSVHLGVQDSCMNCVVVEERCQENSVMYINKGVCYHGITFHVHDFVLFKPDNDMAPADLGQVIGFHNKKSSLVGTVRIRKFGRVSDIMRIKDCPDDVIKHQQHLFLTDTEIQVSSQDLIRRCVVVHCDTPPDLGLWLSQSSHHFYFTYHFPNPHPQQWCEGRLASPLIPVCEKCIATDVQRIMDLEDFTSSCQSHPLRGFDPFSGVGGFGLGMEEAGCLKIKYAIEISPSAAETLRRNAPDVTVYNQCSNVVLEYAIKLHAEHQPQPPKEINTAQTPLTRPPQPGDVNCIVAGLPCQPHSSLNMFQRANDRKSHLILTLLSWVDFLRPQYCYLENVRGFMNLNLNSTQASQYQVKGGITMGGLKFVVNTLLTMGYQVRFGLLQAAHYGTPQSRVRFFLIAALHSHYLPDLPQPTHNFALTEELSIKFPNNGIAWPIQTQSGLAPFQFITIEDAISDLPRFHWRNPDALRQRPGNGPQNVPELLCDSAALFCGIQGSEFSYRHPPHTEFQAKCRQKGTTNIQHFTRVFKDSVVKRVIKIPLKPGADYRDLRHDFGEWQLVDPSSAVARSGYKPGWYGRLDKDRWFHTTVTNVGPTAKQCWVLNPYCRRILTVRELARSQGFPDHFVFYATNGDVQTMHRQIGNAVPLPVAAALGRELRAAVFKKWKEKRGEAIILD